MDFYKGRFRDISMWLQRAIIDVKTLVTSPPRPIRSSDVKKIKYVKQTATEIKATEDFVVSDKLPKNLCNPPCPIDIEYEGDCGDPLEGYIPKDGSEQIEDTLHYADPVDITKPNQLVHRKYVEQLKDALVAQCTNTAFSNNGKRDIRLATPRDSSSDFTYTIWFTTRATYTFMIIGGGGSGGSLVGHHWETINAQVEGGRAGEVHSITMEVLEGEWVEVRLGKGGTPVTATYDNTVQDSAPYYSTDGNAGEASTLIIYQADGSVKYTATASGGAGGSSITGVKRATKCNTTPYLADSYTAYWTNYFAPNYVEYEQTSTHFVLYVSENSCIKAGVAPTYSLAQGVTDVVAEACLDGRYHSNHYSIGGRACFNGFDKTDSQVFTATSGIGGRGVFRMIGDTCDKI